MQLIARAAIVAAALAFALGAAPGLWTSSDSSMATGREITLIYVGAEDCAACRAWQRVDAPMLRSSTEFARLTYREVKSPSVLDVLKDAHWPDDLRPFRDRILPQAGVPLWLIVTDARVVAQGFGSGQWQRSVLPRLRALMR